MIGYKLFDMELKISGFQFEVGKIYEMNDDYRFCKDCFYVFPSIENLLENTPLYSLGRICKVKIYESINKSENLVHKFEILNEIDYRIFKTNKDTKYKMLNLMFNHNSSDLDVLVYDDSKTVRSLVAEFGDKKHLDVLVNDKDARVRVSVAKRNMDEYLDRLVSDENPTVREAVSDTRKKKYLEILKDDPDSFVRNNVDEILNGNEELNITYNKNADASFYPVIKSNDLFYVRDAIENTMFNIISELTEHKDPVIKEKMNILFNNLTEYSNICDDLLDE
jgi:hypothetical protein